jgi:F-type H+-transporting ATPase subunit b
MRVVLLAVFALVLVLAAPALAAGGEEAPSLFWTTVNFVILVAALFYFVRKPALTFFAERRDGIRQDLAQAAELKKQAEERYAKWQRRLADLEQELDGIRDTARQRAEEERESILADARASAERIQRDATAAIEQETRRAQEQLRDDASNLSIELAAGILKQQVGDSDRDRLLDEFISRIEQAPRANGGGN